MSHHGFLDLTGEDPRRAIAEQLLAVLEASAPHCIIAYNASFERGVMRALADRFSDLAEGLRAWADKVVDLLPVTRAHYYHPDQRGSWSIKAVLPCLASHLSYEGMAVADGQAAQLAWLEAVLPTTSAERRAAIRSALEAYCERDTLAMVEILRKLCG